MSTRLTTLLMQLAAQHAPHLIAPGWDAQPDALKRVARGLANYEVLVLMGGLPQAARNDPARHIENWTAAYARLHQLVIGTLFPNYAGFSLTLPDYAQPALAVYVAQISPMVGAMAGYLVPYLASRQAHTHVSEGELRVLMDAILDRVAADDLSRPIYNMLAQDGIQLIRQMLTLPVQHIALTDFDRKLFADVPKPSIMPPKTGPLPTVKPSDSKPTAPAPEVPPPAPSDSKPTAPAPLPPPIERVVLHPIKPADRRSPPAPGWEKPKPKS
ncbi:MAG: hypothetical protein H7Y11_11815 [Armatimonadetes bacterium]|nr:hypothetical protein [Anaerolineae bacterium]